MDQSVWFDSALDTLQVRPLPRCYHPSLGALVLSMLDKEPQHRPGAGQVRQALQVGAASALQSRGSGSPAGVRDLLVGLMQLHFLFSVSDVLGATQLYMFVSVSDVLGLTQLYLCVRVGHIEFKTALHVC